MSYKVISKDGRDVLCMYKVEPADLTDISGFMGREAAILAGVVPVEFDTFRAALQCAKMHGGDVESPTIPNHAEPVLRSVNGGW